MILVNGAKGIGTGFSTDIMCYNPKQIIHYLEGMLLNVPEAEQKSRPVEPYYRGFKGAIYAVDETRKKYLIKGVYEISGPDKIKITELPVGTWTQDYKEFLEGLVSADKDKDKKSKSTESYVKDYVDMSTDINIEFTVTFYPGVLSKLLAEKYDYGVEGIEKLLKLYTTQSTTNMHLFNEKEQLRKYENVYDIIKEYYSIRYEYYNKRKIYLVDKLEKELKTLSNRARYIQDTLDDRIDLRKRSKTEIEEMLTNLKFDLGESGDYNYLIKMPMDSVSRENVERLMKEHGEKETNLDQVKSSTVEKMWLEELGELKKYL
jgi:DNA topoisomerase-2